MQYFKNFDEVYDDLQKIKPLEKDLTQEQSVDAVMDTVKQVMINILRASRCKLTQENVSVYSYMLKKLGLVEYNKANSCFKSGDKYIGDSLGRKNSIEFPLSAFTQIIDASLDSAEYGISKMADGWIQEWLEAQEKPVVEEKNEEEIDSGEPKYFTNFQDILADLQKIQPLEKDLTQASDIQDVLPTVKRTMVNILASSRYKFSKDEYHQYIKALKNLGLTTYNEGNDVFKHNNVSVEDLLDLKDDIGFPLSAFTQILDYDYDTFTFGMDLMADGKEYCWISQWLKSQDIPYNKINNYIKQYDYDVEYNKNKAEKGLTGKFKYFTNFDDILKDLQTIKPLKYSMSSEDLTFNDVYPTIERLMVNLKSCKNYRFTEEEAQKYSDELKKLGFVRFKELPESIKEKRQLDDAKNYEKNDIIAPLKMISQLLSDNIYKIHGGLEVFNMREDDSFVSRWLTSQGLDASNFSAFIEMYNEVYNKEELEALKPKTNNEQKHDDSLEL